MNSSSTLFDRHVPYVVTRNGCRDACLLNSLDDLRVFASFDVAIRKLRLHYGAIYFAHRLYETAYSIGNYKTPQSNFTRSYGVMKRLSVTVAMVRCPPSRYCSFSYISGIAKNIPKGDCHQVKDFSVVETGSLPAEPEEGEVDVVEMDRRCFRHLQRP
jgi:hypothetical protein